MSSLISNQDWADISQAFADAGDTFANATIIWRRSTSSLSRYAEGDNNQFTDITLTCLANYNYFRSWPITNTTETGEQDRESVQLLFSKPYLRALGYLNADDYFDFNPALDRFMFEGKLCKGNGDTSVSQLKGSTAWFALILRREEKTTGE